MGYADYKVYYESTDPSAVLNLRVQVSAGAPHLRVCAQNHKESLKHGVFYLDQNVSGVAGMVIGGTGTAGMAGGGAGGVYTASPQRAVWTKRKYVGDECTLLTELPPGEHVLGVAVNPTAAGARAIVSHLVLYE
jgi:hypothetical protein